MESADTNKGEITWHTEALPRKTRKALEFLATQKWLSRSHWYLAGGTALALSVGHRRSLDLDFFIAQKSFSLSAVMSRFPKDIWIPDIARENTIYGTLLGAKISFIAYPFFFPAFPVQKYGAVRLLQPPDIAVMKIVAISQRGRKRDFVDLYWYCMHRESLGDILRRLPAQYPTVAHDYHHILKSLTYFADADEDVMPTIFFRVTWQSIKRYFEREVPKLTREFLGLS